MAKQAVSLGTVANDGTGDSLRVGGGKINSNFDELYAFNGGSKGADIASATTTDLSTATGDFVKITGTTTITGLGTVAAGAERVLQFAGALTLTYNATSLILPTAASITTAANDIARFRSLGSGNWICVGYVRASGQPIIGNASAGDVQAGTSTTKLVTPSAFAGAAAPQTLTDGATVAWDMALGFNAKVTIAGNRTLTVSNPTVGWTYCLGVIQDGTGSRTMTWPASFDWGTVGAPTLSTTASKRDRVTVFCTDAATPKFDAFLSGRGFS